MTTRYSPELADYICEQLALGRSLTSICNEKNPELGLPVNRPTVLSWVARDLEGFQARYDRARLDAADSVYDQVLDIAQELGNVKEWDGKGVMNRSKALEAKMKGLQWAAEKANPHKYGQRPAELQLLLPPSPEQVDAQLRAMLGLQGNGKPVLEHPPLEKLDS